MRIQIDKPAAIKIANFMARNAERVDIEKLIINVYSDSHDGGLRALVMITAVRNGVTVADVIEITNNMVIESTR